MQGHIPDTLGKRKNTSGHADIPQKRDASGTRL